MRDELSITIADANCLTIYASIASRYTTSSRYLVVETEGQLDLREISISQPFKKDYDLEDQDGPLTWSQKFNLTQWDFLLARDGSELVAAAAVVSHSPDICLLNGRSDLALLWDIRVQPGRIREGIGRQIFMAAENCARRRGCSTLKIETQNTNTAACKFYCSLECKLHGFDPFAYSEFPEETQLIWLKQLGQEDKVH